jgi:hypothetical protein
LSQFGKLITPLQEEEYDFGSEDEDECKDAVGTGNLAAKMTIEREIPQFLPMLGRKVSIYYRGIQKLCVNCYQAGHIKKNCSNQTVGWIKYVKNFKQANNFPDEMYGNWIRILKLNKSREKKTQQKEDHLKKHKGTAKSLTLRKSNSQPENQMSDKEQATTQDQENKKPDKQPVQSLNLQQPTATQPSQISNQENQSKTNQIESEATFNLVPFKNRQKFVLAGKKTDQT